MLSTVLTKYGDGIVKTRSVVVIVAVVALGFSAVTLANHWALRAWIRQAVIENDLPLTSDTVYSEIQKDLLKPIFVSSLMANDTFVRDWVLAGETNPDSMIRYLSEIQKRYGAFTSFFVSERSRVYYQAKGILKSVREDEPRDTWFFRVRDMQPPYETNVDPDMANDDSMTVFINYRVMDYDGRFLGATGVGLQSMMVKQLVERYQKVFHRTVYFVSRDGELRLHGREFDATEPNIRKRPGLSLIADDVLATKEGRFSYDRGDETIFLNSRYIPELDWYLLVEQNASVSMSQAEQSLVQSLIMGLAATFVVTLLCWAFVRRSHRRLAELAMADPLTGVNSRLAFDVIYTQARQRALRSSAPISLVFLDIDYFKTINDRYGHAVGDAALVSVVEQVCAVIRTGDALCRWGGEEFLLLLEACDVEQARDIAETIRLAVEQMVMFSQTGEPFSLTISAGVAQLRDGETVDALVSRADAGLYRVKENGRNQVICVG